MLIPSIVLLMSLAVVHSSPNCGTKTCTDDKTCKWTCEGNTGDAIDPGTCTTEEADCGTAGKCKSACEPKQEATTTAASENADNGSVKLGLSTLVLVFGVLTRMFLQY